MPAAMHRLARHILQRVVHEAHVPLEAEAQITTMGLAAMRLAVIGRQSHARPGGGFLGDGHEACRRAVYRAVQRPQEADRFPVFAPARFIGQPFAGFARIIAIQHRCHGIDAQTIDMELFGPVKGVVDQEADDFAPPEIIDRGVPVGVKAQARVFVFVKRGAVEARQPMFVDGKMRGHPVEQHPDAGPMRAIDKPGKACRRPEPRGWRIQPGGLIAPAGIVGMLEDGHELDMGEAQIGHIGDQLRGQFIPIQKAAMRSSPPRSGMHLVNRDRLGTVIDPSPIGAVRAVAPFLRDRPCRQ